MSVLAREINRILKDRVYLFIGAIAPMIGFTLITLIFSANVPRKLPVAVVDQDHSMLSRKIIRMIGATPIAHTDNHFTSPAEAEKSLQSGETDAIVIIPAGTERKIIRGEHAEVAVYFNNVYLIKAGLLKSGKQTKVGSCKKSQK